ncbi:MAG: ABC transporter substrate-binding protein [Hungatella sp.]|nr:ABC transporter substrate-binding protein [Hungatella sp.]
MKGWIGCAGALLCIACLAGCDRSSRTVPADFHADEELVVYCPHPLEFINPIVSEFEEQTGIKVEICTGGTGELLKMAEDRKEPECDIFWGGSLSTTMAQSELFEPYISKNESMIQEDYRNKEGNMTRFTDVPSILMVNTNLAGDLSIEGYGDLLMPELSGKIAMCDPVTSSSAFEHLINMLYAMGEGEPEEGWDYVEAFCKNLDGKLLQSSSEVYQGVAEGRYTVGLTFEEGAAHYIASGNPVRVVYMEEGVISKPDVVCIIKGSGHMWEAKQFVDFVTGKDAQTVISESLGRRSVRTDVEEPEYLLDKQAIHIIYDEEAVVKENKLEWMRRFSEVFQGTLN